MTFYNGHRNTACNLYVHSYGRQSGFSQYFPTFIAAVIEFTPDRSLVVTQPLFTCELPRTVAINKAFSMSDFHVFPELKIIRELSRALFTWDHVAISPPPVKPEGTICVALCHSVCLSHKFSFISWLCFHISVWNLVASLHMTSYTSSSSVWNLVASLHMTSYTSSSTFVTVDLLFRPFFKIRIPELHEFTSAQSGTRLSKKLSLWTLSFIYHIKHIEVLSTRIQNSGLSRRIFYSFFTRC